MPIIEHVIDNFPNGVIDTIESKDIPEGAASKSLNWMTSGDRVELRRGQIAVGTESVGAGKITGLWTAYRADGVAVVFRKNGQKCQYFINGVSTDWAETGSNMFPAAAITDSATFANYNTSAGNQCWVSSPNSGLFKILVANPDTFVTQSDPTNNFSGQFRMKITQNRMLAWGRIKDKTGLYGSYIDAQKYTTTSNETYGTGNGSATTFAHTLAALGTPQTCFAVSVYAPTVLKTITAITLAANAQVTSAAHGLTVGQIVLFQNVAGMTQINNLTGTITTVVDANNFAVNINSLAFSAYTSGGTASVVEIFTDNYSGVLTGSLGGSGTINYATGAVSITCNTAPGNTATITTTYQLENSSNNGIADFTKSSPRTAGQGFIFRQDEDGSDNQNSLSFNGHEYCFHVRRTWDFNITDTDTNASNLPYRAKVGISNWSNAVATSTGVYYLNDIDKNNIKLERLELNRYMGVVPHVLSKQVTKEGVTLGVILDGYVFDQGFMWEFGDLILLACRTSDSTTNNRTITFNKLTNAIDYLDYTVNCLATVGSEIWAGDSISPNVYKILNGFDDNNSLISNSWEGKASLLGSLYIKRCRRLVLQGVIAVSQSFDVYGAPDNGDYVYIGTISGSGSYVDRGRAVSITIGYGSVGGNDVGGNSDTVNGYNYEHKLKIPFSKFVQVRLKFQATGIGYLSVSRIRWYDILLKYLRILKKYA